MIHIDDKLISEDILKSYFVCDLSACQGGCCEEGDAGAPLDSEEREQIEKAFPFIESALTEEAKETIRRCGKYVRDEEGDWTATTIGKGMCVYGKRAVSGTIECLFQQAYREGKIDWEKPISCHLFPIIARKGKFYETLNYQPRAQLCKPACSLGEKEKIKAYTFLERPLVRKYGKAFVEALEEIDRTYFHA